MIVTANIEEVRKQRWANPTQSWGLVPTMGALHDGHLDLVRRAKQSNDYTAVTIFINPKQFAANEDLAQYPRDLERDLALLKKEGVDLVFTPTEKMMYPTGFLTRVAVDKLPRRLEGSRRPTHFSGVTLIVCKLFNIVQPTRAYFGQKDAQQTIIIQRMVADLNINTEVVVCPTKRDSSGLALSSRNIYLTPEQRLAAPILNLALTRATEAFNSGAIEAKQLRGIMQETLEMEPLARPDYISIADLETLNEVEQVKNRPVLLSLAVYLGTTRLIDNRVIGKK